MSSVSNFQTVSHVIFDMDGLLLDTESIYTVGIQKFLDRYGKMFTPEIKQLQMGRPAAVSAKIAIDMLELPCSVEEYIAGTQLFLRELFVSVPLLPGAAELVRHLSEANIPIALCTGSPRHMYELKSRDHQQLFGLFHHHVFCTDDAEVEHGKPHPDCFLVTASRFDEKPHPSKVLVFEDASNGVQAALSAGMQVVMVPSQPVELEPFADKATVLLKSLTEFNPAHFGLPSHKL